MKDPRSMSLYEIGTALANVTPPNHYGGLTVLAANLLHELARRDKTFAPVEQQEEINSTETEEDGFNTVYASGCPCALCRSNH